MAEEKPHTKIPDSEIRPENIILGSPLFIPFKWEKSKGKGKHSKNIKIPVSNSNSEMPHRKRTKTKAELRLDAKNRAVWAWCSADMAKKAILKLHQTPAMGKPPHRQLATEAPPRNRHS